METESWLPFMINNETRNSAADKSKIENLETNQPVKYIIHGKMRYSILL
jgi:hypothetical protein